MSKLLDALWLKKIRLYEPPWLLTAYIWLYSVVG